MSWAVQGFAAEERNLRSKVTRFIESFATGEPVYTLPGPASYTKRLNKEALRTLDMVVEGQSVGGPHLVRDTDSGKVPASGSYAIQRDDL